MPILGALFAFLGGWVARIIGSAVLRFVAMKAILYLLVTAILPVILYNLFNSILTEIMTVAAAAADSENLEPFVIQFTGFAGWLAVKLKVPEAFSVIISSAIFRMAISFIPFIGRA